MGYQIRKALTKEGMIIYEPTLPATIRLNRQEAEDILRKKLDWDSLPDAHCETVHIEVTSDCNRRCPYCYNPKNTSGMKREEILELLGILDKHNVFQITFGGGEPFMRTDIYEMAYQARMLGLNVCATTNGDILAQTCASQSHHEYLSGFRQINLSYHGDNKFFSNLGVISTACKEVGIKVGINFCCTEPYMKELDLIALKARMFGAELLLLSYKPVVMDYVGSPSGTDIVLEGLRLAQKYKISVAVDSSCVRQCQASRRFVDIHPNGDVSVCSFKREPIGNVFATPFADIWANRPRSVVCPYFPQVTNTSLSAP